MSLWSVLVKQLRGLVILEARSLGDFLEKARPARKIAVSARAAFPVYSPEGERVGVYRTEVRYEAQLPLGRRVCYTEPVAAREVSDDWAADAQEHGRNFTLARLTALHRVYFLIWVPFTDPETIIDFVHEDGTIVPEDTRQQIKDNAALYGLDSLPLPSDVRNLSTPR